MQIQIISTNVETKPTAKGSYQQLEVVYKNLTFQGKVESKKLMSFGDSADAFKALSGASSGQVYDIDDSKKNAQGYKVWTNVKQSTGEVAAASAPKTSPAPKSTYETPEERAQRQVLIVRQSSLASAVSALTPGAKAPLKAEDVIAVAQQFENYVFGIKDPGPTGFDDIPDFDIPTVE